MSFRTIGKQAIDDEFRKNEKLGIGETISELEYALESIKKSLKEAFVNRDETEMGVFTKERKIIEDKLIDLKCQKLKIDRENAFIARREKFKSWPNFVTFGALCWATLEFYVPTLALCLVFFESGVPALFILCFDVLGTNKCLGIFTLLYLIFCKLQYGGAVLFAVTMLRAIYWSITCQYIAWNIAGVVQLVIILCQLC